MTDHTLDKLFLDGLLGDSIQSLLYVPPVAQKIIGKIIKHKRKKKKKGARANTKKSALQLDSEFSSESSCTDSSSESSSHESSPDSISEKSWIHSAFALATALATLMRFRSASFFLAVFAVCLSFSCWLCGVFDMCAVQKRDLVHLKQVHLASFLRRIPRGPRHVPKPILSAATHHVQYPPTNRISISRHSGGLSVMPASRGG